MRKFHLLFGFSALLFVLIGHFVASQNPVFWLTDTSVQSSILRFVLLVAILLQLVISPPRHKSVNAITLGIGAATIVYALHTLGMSSSPILDTVLFAQVGITLILSALELGARPNVIRKTAEQ